MLAASTLTKPRPAPSVRIRSESDSAGSPKMLAPPWSSSTSSLRWMVAMVVGHSLVLLACASLSAWWEAAHPRHRHDPVPPLLLASAAVWLVAVQLLGPLPGPGTAHV